MATTEAGVWWSTGTSKKKESKKSKKSKTKKKKEDYANREKLSAVKENAMPSPSNKPKSRSGTKTELTKQVSVASPSKTVVELDDDFDKAFKSMPTAFPAKTATAVVVTPNKLHNIDFDADFESAFNNNNNDNNNNVSDARTHTNTIPNGFGLIDFDFDDNNNDIGDNNMINSSDSKESARRDSINSLSPGQQAAQAVKNHAPKPTHNDIMALYGNAQPVFHQPYPPPFLYHAASTINPPQQPLAFMRVASMPVTNSIPLQPAYFSTSTHTTPYTSPRPSSTNYFSPPGSVDSQNPHWNKHKRGASSNPFDEDAEDDDDNATNTSSNPFG